MKQFIRTVAVLPAVLFVLCAVGLPLEAATAEDAKWRSHMDEADKALERFNYSRARRHLEKALARAESQNLARDALMESLIKLGDTHRVLRHPGESGKYFERALEISEAQFGGQHRLAALAYYKAGLLYEDYRWRQRAESYYRQAFAAAKRNLALDDPLRSDIEDKLGQFNLQRQRPKSASSFFLRALARREQAREPDEEGVARTLLNLGVAYRMQALFGQAEEILVRALGLAQKKPGPGSSLHMSIGSSLFRTRLSREIRDGIERQPGATQESFKGIEIIVSPPRAPFTTADLQRGLSEIKTALRLLHERSPYIAEKLNKLVREARPVLIFDPRFPSDADYGLVGEFFPYIFDDDGGKAGEKKLPVVIGRNIVPRLAEADPKKGRWTRGNLALTLAHELVGHGVQELRRGRRLWHADAECEALLYEYAAQVDLRQDLGSEFSVLLRAQMEEGWCWDFREFMRESLPEEMPLWEERNLDARRLIRHFDVYAATVMRKK